MTLCIVWVICNLISVVQCTDFVFADSAFVSAVYIIIGRTRFVNTDPCNYVYIVVSSNYNSWTSLNPRGSNGLADILPS